MGKKGCQARQVETVQNCFSTFASLKPLDIFKETPGMIPAMLVGQKLDIFEVKLELLQPFQAKHDLFLTPTKWGHRSA